MDYSRIRNAIDREIHISGLSHGCLCTLEGAGYYIIHVDVEGQFSAEFEILNKEIYTIRSYSTIDGSKFKAGINNGDFYFSSSSYASFALRLGVEYTTSAISIKNNSTTYGVDYNFGRLYVLKALEFNGAGIGVNDMNIAKLDITNFTANNATLNLESNNVSNIGDLHIKDLHLDIMDIDTLYADVIDSTSVKLGNWTLTKTNNEITVTVS